MRRLLLSGLFLTLVGILGVGESTPIQAQAPDNLRTVSFKTADDVTLEGVLTKSAKGGNSPVVLMLHSPSDDPNKGDFKGLATTLAEEGFNVFRFDFRGHGKSTLVNPTKFWNDPINATFMKAQATKRKPKIEAADYRNKSNYFCRLADDVMAARVALDQLNDNGDVNTSSVYIIGAKDAATLGLLYLTAEWSRPQKYPSLPMINYSLVPRPSAVGMTMALPSLDTPTAGQDVAGAIWLSPARHPSVPTSTMQQWVRFAPELRDRTPMLFIAGADDTLAKNAANSYIRETLANKIPGAAVANLPLTQLRVIEKTNLKGAELLGKSLGTEKMIVEYLKVLEKERKNMIRISNRGFQQPPPINFPTFGVCRP
jgi:pimeloyl-ACP methyl ester carboxylesterase